MAALIDTTTPIGFVGLGVMGAPMARNLQKADYSLTFSRENARTGNLVESGATPASTPREVAEASDVVLLMLPDSPDVVEAITGEEGVLAGLRPGATVIDMSSISPVVTKELASAVEAAGGAYIDAPVSGGEVGAKEATLSIMVGGAERDVERIRPLLEALGKNITHIGPVGTGQTAKVANQVIVAVTIEAVAEALVLAEAAGADPAVVREALLGGFASSKILEVHGKRMIDKTFDPGFRVRLHRKDLALALGTGDSLNLGLPATALVQQMFNARIAAGDGDLDHSVLHRQVSQLAGR